MKENMCFWNDGSYTVYMVYYVCPYSGKSKYLELLLTVILRDWSEPCYVAFFIGREDRDGSVSPAKHRVGLISPLFCNLSEATQFYMSLPRAPVSVLKPKCVVKHFLLKSMIYLRSFIQTPKNVIHKNVSDFCSIRLKVDPWDLLWPSYWDTFSVAICLECVIIIMWNVGSQESVRNSLKSGGSWTYNVKIVQIMWKLVLGQGHRGLMIKTQCLLLDR